MKNDIGLDRKIIQIKKFCFDILSGFRYLYKLTAFNNYFDRIFYL